MKRMKRVNLKLSLIALLALSVFAFNSCEKYDTDIEGDIAIYTLKEYDKKAESSEILNSGLVLDDLPLISYDEITLYNSKTHTFQITESAAERVKNLYQSAFAVVLEGEIIYTAYFWSGISSHIVDWTVTDILSLETSQNLHVQLGYPYLMDDMNIPDKRNDNRLLSVFERDGKLLD